MTDINIENSDTTNTTEEIFKRPNAIFIRGVDNLSTKEVTTYIKKITEEPFKVEWINDSSLNIAFEEEQHATEALKKLSQDQEIIDDELERPAILLDETNPDLVLTVRISNTGDKKVKNAAQYSRYYLFNPKENERERRPRKNYRDRDSEGIETRRRNRRRNRSPEDDLDLFPEKTSTSDITNTSIRQSSDVENDDLSSRIQPKSETNSLSSRIGVPSSNIDSNKLDEDDLFK